MLDVSAPAPAAPKARRSSQEKVMVPVNDAGEANANKKQEVDLGASMLGMSIDSNANASTKQGSD